MRGYVLLLRRYSPNEADNFAKKYSEGWQTAYLNRRVLTSYEAPLQLNLGR